MRLWNHQFTSVKQLYSHPPEPQDTFLILWNVWSPLEFKNARGKICPGGLEQPTLTWHQQKELNNPRKSGKISWIWRRYYISPDSCRETKGSFEKQTYVKKEKSWCRTWRFYCRVETSLWWRPENWNAGYRYFHTPTIVCLTAPAVRTTSSFC